MSPTPEDLDHIAAGIAFWNRDRTLRYANGPFATAFNLDGALPEGISFQSCLERMVLSNELVLLLPRTQWIAAELAGFGDEKAVEQLMADGRTLHVVQRPTADGGMAVTVHDISNLKRVETALRHAKDRAESIGEAKSRFLRAANHDLRQPLATLRILIFNCIGEHSDEHRKESLHAMDISVSIMDDLLGALLQVGQLDAGQIVARVTTFQIGQVFERLRVQFAHQAAEKGLKLRFVAMRGAVVSDKALLERILTNYLANAIRYTDVGGIVVGCRRRGRDVGVEVYDTGRGIADGDLQRVFDEFYQVVDGREDKRPGLGLGLNIVKRLADLLDHPISVRSAPGRGSIFGVTMQRGDVWQSEVAEPEISEMIAGEFAGIAILLIEDDDVLRRAMTELLERWGLRVTPVTSGTEALDIVRSKDPPIPNLIIADYSLRGQLGTKVVESLREALPSPVPAFVITADVDPATLDRIRAAGFPVLNKPVSPPRLRVMMHNLLFEPNALAALATRERR